MVTSSEHRLAIDKAAASNDVHVGRADRKRFDQIAEVLDADESVLAVLSGQAENAAGKNTIGTLVLTSRRLIYVGSLVFQSSSESFPLERVDSVQMSSGLALAGLTLTVAGAKFKLDKSNKNDTRRFAEAVKTAIASLAPPRSEHASVADELSKLAALRDQGILSHEEFATLKAKLLG